MMNQQRERGNDGEQHFDACQFAPGGANINEGGIVRSGSRGTNGNNNIVETQMDGNSLRRLMAVLNGASQTNNGSAAVTGAGVTGAAAPAMNGNGLNILSQLINNQQIPFSFFTNENIANNGGNNSARIMTSRHNNINNNNNNNNNTGNVNNTQTQLQMDIGQLFNNLSQNQTQNNSNNNNQCNGMLGQSSLVDSPEMEDEIIRRQEQSGNLKKIDIKQLLLLLQNRANNNNNNNDKMDNKLESQQASQYSAIGQLFGNAHSHTNNNCNSHSYHGNNCVTGYNNNNNNNTDNNNNNNNSNNQSMDSNGLALLRLSNENENLNKHNDSKNVNLPQNGDNVIDLLEINSLMYNSNCKHNMADEFGSYQLPHQLLHESKMGNNSNDILNNIMFDKNRLLFEQESRKRLLGLNRQLHMQNMLNNDNNNNNVSDNESDNESSNNNSDESWQSKSKLGRRRHWHRQKRQAKHRGGMYDGLTMNGSDDSDDENDNNDDNDEIDKTNLNRNDSISNQFDDNGNTIAANNDNNDTNDNNNNNNNNNNNSDSDDSSYKLQGLARRPERGQRRQGKHRRGIRGHGEKSNSNDSDNSDDNNNDKYDNDNNESNQFKQVLSLNDENNNGNKIANDNNNNKNNDNNNNTNMMSDGNDSDGELTDDDITDMEKYNALKKQMEILTQQMKKLKRKDDINHDNDNASDAMSQPKKRRRKN